MIGIGNYVSDGLAVTPEGWFARILAGGAIAPIAALGPGLLPLLPFLTGKKKKCFRQFPFNKAKRKKCLAEAEAKAASLELKSKGNVAKMWGGGSVSYGTSAGPMTTLPYGVAPADMSPYTDEERASMAPAGGGGGIVGMIPWWGWVAAAGVVGVGGYLLLRRKSAA